MSAFRNSEGKIEGLRVAYALAAALMIIGGYVLLFTHIWPESVQIPGTIITFAVGIGFMILAKSRNPYFLRKGVVEGRGAWYNTSGGYVPEGQEPPRPQLGWYYLDLRNGKRHGRVKVVKRVYDRAVVNEFINTKAAARQQALH